MKTRNKLLIILAVIMVFGGLITAAVLLSNGSNEGEIQTKEFTFNEEITNVDIDTSTATVEVYKNNEEGIKVLVDETNLSKYDVNIENGELSIIEDRAFTLFNFSFKKKYVKIYLPDEVYDYDIEITSGSLELADMSEYGQMDIEMSSGSLVIKNCIINNETNIGLTSGKTQLEDVSFKDYVRIEGTSGGIYLKQINAVELKIKSTSGNVSVDGDVKKLNITNTSGSVTIKLENTDISSINANLTSGSIKLYLKQNVSGFKVNSSITSGSYRCDFSDNNPNYYGDGSIEIKTKITSGNFYIYKY